MDSKETEEWRKQMLTHASNWKEMTGRDYPSYEEMLNLSRDYFETFLMARAGIPEWRVTLLQEMREHELKTVSFTKDEANEPFEAQIVSKIFSVIQGKEITEAIEDIDALAKKYGKADDGQNPVILAIYAKAGHDYNMKNK